MIPVECNAHWRHLNKVRGLPAQNSRGSLLVIGCNYHTTWQRDPGMRFVLDDVEGTVAKLRTRSTRKIFSTNVEDLIFIDSVYNRQKADRLSKIPD